MLTPRRIIVVITAVSLSAAFVINAIWFATSIGRDRLEPVVGVLGILAGITGLVAERWAARQEARDAALDTIGTELEANDDLLSSSPLSARIRTSRSGVRSIPGCICPRWTPPSPAAPCPRPAMPT